MYTFSGCRASITLVASKGMLRVLAFDMKHNHLCGIGHTMSWKRRRHTDEPAQTYPDPIYKDVPLNCQDSETPLLVDAHVDPSLPAGIQETFASIFNGSPIPTFDKLCYRMKKYNEATGSAFVFSHGVRADQAEDENLKILYKVIAFVCIRAGSDSISCKVGSTQIY